MAKGDRPKLEDFTKGESSGGDQDVFAVGDDGSGGGKSGRPGVDDFSESSDDDFLSGELAEGDDLGSVRDADPDADLDADLDDDDSAASGQTREVEGDVLSLRDALAARGMQFGEDVDDEEVLGSLVSQMQAIQQERQQWQQQQAQWQQWYHQQELARYQQQQQQQYAALQNQQFAMQQAAAAQRQREYRGLLAFVNNPPEFHESWLQFIGRDEQGNLTLKPGADPQLLQKLTARRQWEDQVQRTLMEKPVEFVQEAMFQNPTVQQYFAGIAQQVAGSMVAEAMARQHAIIEYREQQNHAAARALRETSGWIQDKDGNLTEAGSLYLQAVQEAANNPQLRTVEQQHEWAMRYVAPYWQLAQQRASQNAATPKESGVAKGSKTRIGLLKKAATAGKGRAGSLPRTERKVPTQDRRLTLEQMLKRDLSAAGLGV